MEFIKDYSYLFEMEKGGVALYTELSPSERILKLMNEFVCPELDKAGFKFSKSQKTFKKTQDKYQYIIKYYSNMRNYSSEIVEFGLHLCVSYPKYTKWLIEYYRSDIIIVGSTNIDCSNVAYIEGWDRKYLDAGHWYGLQRSDNKLLMENIVNNIKTAGFKYFSSFETTEGAISLLIKFPEKNFNIIFDLYLIDGKIKEAISFFKKYNRYDEKMLKKEGDDSTSDYSLNRKTEYLMRKKKVEELSEQN